MKISQREARRLAKRVAALEGMIARQRSRWLPEYPGGVHIGNINMAERGWLLGRIEGARMLQHAVVVTSNDTNELMLYALPLPEVKP